MTHVCALFNCAKTIHSPQRKYLEYTDIYSYTQSSIKGYLHRIIHIHFSAFIVGKLRP